MRYFALLLPLTMGLITCGRDTPEPAFFANAQQLPPALCSGIDALNARGSIVNDVVSLDSSRFLVLYGAERELVIYDERFQVVSSVSFERDGPRGVRSAVSATMVGETFYIADEKQLLIKLLDSAGLDRGTIRLDFVPRRVRSAGAVVVVSPLVMASHPNSLLFTLSNGRARSLAVPIARYEDVGVNAFANMSSVAGFPDGRIVLMHELIVPFGYSLARAGTASLVRRFAVPLPELQRTRIGKLPVPPLTEKNIGDMVAVALAAAPDPSSGRTYYLTRTGRRVGGSWEKMIVRLDSTFKVERAAPVLDQRPLHMTYLPARGALLLADDEHRWFECTL
jgi:hypothetical protein